MRLVDQGAFLEWANVHGNCYGTRRSDVEALLDGGYDVLLEIDWQGAAQVAERMEHVVRVFILPPSMDELRRRLVRRGHDTPEVIEARMRAASEEIAHAGEADLQLVNDDFDRALAALLKLSGAGESGERRHG